MWHIVASRIAAPEQHRYSPKLAIRREGLCDFRAVLWIPEEKVSPSRRSARTRPQGAHRIGALDASSQAAVADIVRKLCLDVGAVLVFISHVLSVVRVIAGRTAGLPLAGQIRSSEVRGS
jgi:hypothetical protein